MVNGKRDQFNWSINLVPPTIPTNWLIRKGPVKLVKSPRAWEKGPVKLVNPTKWLFRKRPVKLVKSHHDWEKGPVKLVKNIVLGLRIWNSFTKLPSFTVP